MPMDESGMPLVLFASERPDLGLLERLRAIPTRAEPRPFAPETTLLDDCGVLVIDGGTDVARAGWFCRTLRARYGDDCPPVVFLSGGDRRAALDAGADVCLPASPDGGE